MKPFLQRLKKKEKRLNYQMRGIHFVVILVCRRENSSWNPFRVNGDSMPTVENAAAFWPC